MEIPKRLAPIMLSSRIVPLCLAAYIPNSKAKATPKICASIARETVGPTLSQIAPSTGLFKK